MIEKHLHDFQVARFKVLQVFQVLLWCQVFLPNFPLFEQYVKPRFPDVSNSSARWYKSNTQEENMPIAMLQASAVENRSSLGFSFSSGQIPARRYK